MDNLNPNQQMPVMPQNPYESEGPKTKSIGTLISIFIVLILIIVGGLYFWGKKMAKEQEINNPTQEQTANTSGDDINSIQKDLSSLEQTNGTTNELLNSIDQELK